MIPKSKYLTLPPEEQKLWHSHEFEVKSGMLVLPTPESHGSNPDAWERLETEAMSEVVGLYGKTWHTWQVDVDEDLPMGVPRLMGSLTEYGQIDMDVSLKDRNERFKVHHKDKARIREEIETPGIPPNADIWWKEAKEQKRGIYS